MNDSRSFFNGKTGHEEAWLFRGVFVFEQDGHKAEYPFWGVTDITDDETIAHYYENEYAKAEADYESRVERLTAQSETGGTE